MVRFTEIIEASIEWTTTVLFRPFKPKKWLILGFIALIAGYMTGSSSNFGGSQGRERTKNAEAQVLSQVRLSGLPGQRTVESSPANIIKQILNKALPQIKNPLAITIILAVIILIILVAVPIMIWLSSRFAFIFLEDVIKNDASIKIPFKRNRKMGNSLFLFKLGLMAIFFVLFGVLIFMCINALIRIGVFDKPAAVGFKQIFLSCLPYALSLLLTFIVFAIAVFIINNFVLVVMFKDKTKIMQTWPMVFAMINANKSTVIKYLFITIGLTICCNIIYAFLFFACLVGLLLPAGISTAAFYFIYLIVPLGLRFLYFIILFIIVIPALLFLFYCLICLYLPFAVFFRTFSIKFIGRLSQDYNLFKHLANKEALP